MFCAALIHSCDVYELLAVIFVSCVPHWPFTTTAPVSRVIHYFVAIPSIWLRMLSSFHTNSAFVFFHIPTGLDIMLHRMMAVPMSWITQKWAACEFVILVEKPAEESRLHLVDSAHGKTTEGTKHQLAVYQYMVYCQLVSWHYRNNAYILRV